jgi:hypothetical protein
MVWYGMKYLTAIGLTHGGSIFLILINHAPLLQVIPHAWWQ